MSTTTFRDFVRQMLDEPDMTDAQADFILWERTPFPLVQDATTLAPYLSRVRAADELRFAASAAGARLSGHSGVSVRWLRTFADAIERGES